MFRIPGYTVTGAIKSTSTSLLFHAVRDVDGLPLILKTPASSSPSSRERDRYRREFRILQRLRDVRGVTQVHAGEQIQDRPALLLENIEGQPLSAYTGEPFELTRALELTLSLTTTLAEI